VASFLKLSVPVQVEIGKVEATLLDNSSGTDIIPSLRLTVSDVFVCLSTETSVSIPSCRASAIVGLSAGTKSSLDVQGQVSSQYFNSSLDVEEVLILV
jgi:hypothetical protein